MGLVVCSLTGSAAPKYTDPLDPPGPPQHCRVIRVIVGAQRDPEHIQGGTSADHCAGGRFTPFSYISLLHSTNFFPLF